MKMYNQTDYCLCNPTRVCRTADLVETGPDSGDPSLELKAVTYKFTSIQRESYGQNFNGVTKI